MPNLTNVIKSYLVSRTRISKIKVFKLGQFKKKVFSSREHLIISKCNDIISEQSL